MVNSDHVINGVFFCPKIKDYLNYSKYVSLAHRCSQIFNISFFVVYRPECYQE